MEGAVDGRKKGKVGRVETGWLKDGRLGGLKIKRWKGFRLRKGS